MSNPPMRRYVAAGAVGRGLTKNFGRREAATREFYFVWLEKSTKATNPRTDLHPPRQHRDKRGKLLWTKDCNQKQRSLPARIQRLAKPSALSKTFQVRAG